MPDEQRAGRFLRTLVGLLLVAWLLAALLAPPDPFAFLLLLAPGWLAAGVVAVWVVYYDGDERLRASRLYDPRAPASWATAVFVGLAIVLKLVLTVGADFLLGEAAVGHTVGVGISAMAVAVAYATVFLAGVLGRLRGRAGTAEG